MFFLRFPHFLNLYNLYILFVFNELYEICVREFFC